MSEAREGALPLEIAERIYDAEPLLVERLKRPCVSYFFAATISRATQRIRKSQTQMSLPGFERIPARITLKDRSRIPLLEANLKELREYDDITWGRGGALHKQVRQLIDDVLVWDRVEPGITVGQVAARRARGETPGAKSRAAGA